MTLTEADLKDMLFTLQAAIDSGLQVDIKQEAIKAMAEELLAARRFLSVGLGFTETRGTHHIWDDLSKYKYMTTGLRDEGK